MNLGSVKGSKEGEEVNVTKETNQQMKSCKKRKRMQISWGRCKSRQMPVGGGKLEPCQEDLQRQYCKREKRERYQNPTFFPSSQFYSF